MPSGEAKKHFAELLKHKKEIEEKLGYELDWQELPDAQACRIVSYYPNAPIEDMKRWDEYLIWIVKRMIKMDSVLRPFVKSIP